MFRRVANRFATSTISCFVLVLSAFASHYASAQTPPLFQLAVTYGWASTPGPLSVVDVNRDGVLDLVINGLADDNTGTIGVLLGDGKGTFQGAGGPYSSESQAATPAAVADVNGDGKPDLVIAGVCAPWLGNCVLGETLVSVLLGNGDGTFQSPIVYKAGGFAGASSVAVLDLNGDSHPDIVVADLRCGSTGFDGCVSVLLGNGDGTFQTVKVYGSGGFNAGQIAVSDVNGDGRPDLLLTNGGGSPSSVGVLLGKGDGTFQAAASYDSGGFSASGLIVSDLNDDNKPDLLVTNRDSGSIAVLLGNGDGTFRTAVTYGSGGNGIVSTAFADVNGDGQADLVVANSGNGVVSVLLGKADGTFGPAVPIDTELPPNGPESIIIADVNRDGRPDVLEIRLFSGTIEVLLGNGHGGFQPGVFYDSGVFRANAIIAADLNGDGSQDLVVTGVGASFNSGTIGVLLNTAVDTTSPIITLSTTPRILWPPNGRLVPVVVSGTITDTGSGVNASSATYAVRDEYGLIHPSGRISLGSGGTYSFVVSLQASRRGSDLDGRHYKIRVRAMDNAGNVGSKSAIVIVPHRHPN
jgi:FG-GAP-like repeat